MATYSGYSDVASATTWTAQFKSVYDAYVTPPSASILTAQALLAKTLIDGGIWSKLDIFYLFANNNEANCLINWINPWTNNAVNNHSTAFGALEGFTGDASADYISINGLNMSGGTNKYKRDSAMVFALSLKSVAQATKVLWGYEGAGISSSCFPFRSTNIFRGRCNDATDTDLASTNSIGYYIINRSSTSSVTVNKNKVKSTNSSSNSIGIAATIDMLRRATNADLYGGYTVSAFAIGSSLNDTEQDALIDAVEAYMDSNGKGIL